MEIPLWVLRNTAYSSGARLPKMKPLEEKERCSVCNGEVLLYKIFIDGKILCRACHIKRQDESSARTYRAPSRVNNYQNNFPWKEDEEERGLGNLDPTEYQFWIGTELNYGTTGLCRACGYLAICKVEREEHKARYDPPCTVQLVGAYKKLLTKGRCLVCETNTIKQRWGVPLCSPNCVQTFQFNRIRNYVSLDVQLMLGRKSGG